MNRFSYFYVVTFILLQYNFCWPKWRSIAAAMCHANTSAAAEHKLLVAMATARET